MRYEYRCTKCFSMFEVDKPMSERNSIEQCPECYYPAQRVFNSVPIILKGYGWSKDGYATYYGDIDKATREKAKKQIKENRKKRK